MVKDKILVLCMFFFTGCSIINKNHHAFSPPKPFLWENATVYFLLTDRFYNGDTGNDFKHSINPAPMRGYMGGDIRGITKKIEDGYFQKLGVNAIWMTPLVENIYGSVDEGTGTSYAYHGYWTKDWSTVDRRLGTSEDVFKMVKSAHKRGIRVIMDVVINHTGPVTPLDTKWPDDWVRTGPNCTYQDYKTTTECTLVTNLPDIRTESLTEVNLPQHLIDKWKSEGRLVNELAELDAFFKRTNYPRRPYFYIIKWLTDLIREFGIDGFRVDTAKHADEEVWKILHDESIIAYNDWKKLNPNELPDFKDFYMVGEVYNYNAGNGRIFDFGDKKVDYFSFGFDALINFEFKENAKNDYAELFTKYDVLLNGSLRGKTLLNYISSHDDGSPFDKSRKKSYESAIKLLLCQGGAQIYYGDESERSLHAKADGDATLRSFMNWDEQKIHEKALILGHWQKIGLFRHNHLSVGAGRHHQISVKPFVFARTYESNSLSDKVVCAIDMPIGNKKISVTPYFNEGDKILDTYSQKIATVKNGIVEFDTPFDIVLLEYKNR